MGHSNVPVAEDSVLEWLHLSQGAVHSVIPKLLRSLLSPTFCVALGSGSLGFSCSESYLYLSAFDSNDSVMDDSQLMQRLT